MGNIYDGSNTLRNRPITGSGRGSRFTYPGVRRARGGPGAPRRGPRVDGAGRAVRTPKGDGSSPGGTPAPPPGGPHVPTGAGPCRGVARPAHSRRPAARSYPGGVSDYRKQPAMRVYVPLTLPGLAEAHKAGELGPGPLRAYAVTPELREWYVSDDIEELEYAALGRAAAASLRLIAADPAAPPRRVVVALDVADGAATAAPGEEEAALGRVALADAVRLSVAAAVHIDADDAEEDVAAAVRAVAAADAGDGDARSAADGAEDHELLWFGVQEIPGLLT